MEVIDNKIYDRIHTTWWDEDGFMAILRNSVNPPRFDYFKKILSAQSQLNTAKLRVLDIGCGGGLLAEQFAAMGCEVTGIDQSLPSLTTAKAHAKLMDLDIEYLHGSAEHLPFADQHFDIVCCCDVLEHLDSIDVVIKELSRVLKPGGIFFFDTINRTFASKFFAIKIAQDCRLTRFVPRNVHVWEKFIRPHELAASLRQHGFPQASFAGLSPNANPFPALIAFARHKFGKLSFAELGDKLKLHEGKNLSVAYMGFSIRAL
jgi:2-polyprenyl-6-hydroxyphenyl methylase/3-demethylubiquinone-9 3-methyltransferase